METYRLLIKGKVQGVFYRVTAKDVADELGLTGWIKNTVDGDVECMVSGPREKLDEFVAWCRKGPKRAVVEEVTWHSQTETSFTQFEVIRN